jgi:hypothetical protein
MPRKKKAPRGQTAARRAAQEVVAAAAAEPAPGGAAAAGRRGSTTSARGTAATARQRVAAALAALCDSLDASPAGATEALGVQGLLATLLREAAAPPGPHAIEAASCLAAIGAAASSEASPARPGQRAAAAALSVALRRDAACLFDAMGRVAAAQAAGRSAGGPAPAGSPPPPAGAGPAAAGVAAAAATPGWQLSVLLRLALHLLWDEPGADGGAYVTAFARSDGALAATLEVLLHGTPGHKDGHTMRPHAASVLRLVCVDTGLRHLRGACPRVVPALLQRLERGAPGSTYEERARLVGVLEVRWGHTRRVEGRRACAPWLGCTARLGPSVRFVVVLNTRPDRFPSPTHAFQTAPAAPIPLTRARPRPSRSSRRRRSARPTASGRSCACPAPQPRSHLCFRTRPVPAATTPR